VSRAESTPILNVHQGQTTLERQDYFMDKFVVPAQAQASANKPFAPLAGRARIRP
jgi:hypothetical protein